MRRFFDYDFDVLNSDIILGETYFEIETVGAYIYVPLNYFESMKPSDQPLQMGEDLPANSTTTGVLVLDGMDFIGEFDFVGDIDWVAIDLDANDIANIQAISPDGLVFTTSFNIVDASGNILLASSTLDFVNSFAYFEAEVAGTYYVSIQDDPSDGGEIGDYTLRAESVIDDHRGTANTLSLVSNDTDATGNIDYVTDEDWFLYQGEAAGDLDVSVTFDGAGMTPALLSPLFLVILAEQAVRYSCLHLALFISP